MLSALKASKFPTTNYVKINNAFLFEGVGAGEKMESNSYNDKFMVRTSF